MRRPWQLLAAVWLVGAAGASAPDDPAASASGPGAASETCELSRVTDRSKVSSLRCIACHDGTTGAGVPFEMGTPGQSMSHPVEVEYERARLRQADRYVPEVLLPEDVPLVEGKVACTSCHDGRSPHARRVVDPARLCYACHQL